MPVDKKRIRQQIISMDNAEFLFFLDGMVQTRHGNDSQSVFLKISQRQQKLHENFVKTSHSFLQKLHEKNIESQKNSDRDQYDKALNTINTLDV